MNVAYQGLAGAYSEAAAAALFPSDTPLSWRTFAEVFAALESGQAGAAVVPVENSHAGVVADVYDLMHSHRNAKVVAEVVVRVRHSLLGVKGATLDGIKVARSHPQALAQCEDFLRRMNIQPQVAYDTAGAAMEVSALGSRTVAAIASGRAARQYGLQVLAQGIETSSDNVTRFFALAREDDDVTARIAPERRTGTLKTSLVYTTKNEPGSLIRSLQPFATAGLQLTKIESRPSRAAAWDYVFYLDFEGDPCVTPGREALALMRTCCEWVQVLGTYPEASEALEPDA